MIHKISAEPRASKPSPRSQTLAGSFYPSEAEELEHLLAAFFDATVTAVSHPKGVLVPHAGYVYSGLVAACSYARISPEFSGTFVLIGTHHQGRSNSVSTLDWETPLGIVSCDTEFADALTFPQAGLPLDNDAARLPENSLETQMPFIAYRFPKAQIVAILMGDQSRSAAQRIAEAVVSAKKATGREIIVIASGDCSHYVPATVAETDDLTTLAAIKNLETDRFYEALQAVQPSMCGYGCIAAMAEIGRLLGAVEARVLTYATSGDVLGEYDAVVGYAALEVI